MSLTPTNATVIESEGFVEFKLEVLTPDVNTPLPLEIFIDMIPVSGTAGKWIIALAKILRVQYHRGRASISEFGEFCFSLSH